jgi:HEAT repeat protein
LANLLPVTAPADVPKLRLIRDRQEDPMDLRLRNFMLLALLLASLPLFSTDPTTPQPRQQAWTVLNSGLAHTKAQHRVEAVRALSLVTGERAAVKLALHALADDNTEVRATAATTLGQLHATSAIPDLRQALSDKEIAVVLAASQALYQLRDKSAYGVYYAILMGDKKASDGLIQSQIDRLKDPKKLALLGFQEGMGFIPYGGIGVEAYRAAKNDNSQVRAAAARFLAHDPDPMSGDALVQIALADNNANVRQAALDALADRGDPTCIERLRRNLSDPKVAVRYRTAAAILHLSDLQKKVPRKKDSQPFQLK